MAQAEACLIHEYAADDFIEPQCKVSHDVRGSLYFLTRCNWPFQNNQDVDVRPRRSVASGLRTEQYQADHPAIIDDFQLMAKLFQNWL